ncbi:MAG: hypothetical protein JW866_09040 [Ignavibacteriales bacterium]|nr:hypothetical protein [Ignavibacteriales bacterium]
MPKLEFINRPDITVEKLHELLSKNFEEKYQSYMSKLPAVDFALKKSNWTGVAFKLKDKGDKKILVYNAFSPSAAVRLLALGIIPLLIMNSVSWKPMLTEVTNFLNSCNELK